MKNDAKQYQKGDGPYLGGKMLKPLLGFLFGKQTDIFNKKGRVQHDLGSEKWKNWDNRLKENPNYNWKDHKGKSGYKKDTH